MITTLIDILPEESVRISLSSFPRPQFRHNQVNVIALIVFFFKRNKHFKSTQRLTLTLILDVFLKYFTAECIW